MNTDDLRRQYKGVAYPPLVAAICFFDSEGFEDDANQAAEKYASYQAIATAARPFAHPDLCKRLPNNGTSSDDQAVIFVRNNAVITLADCKKLAAALAALEQKTK